MKRTIATILLLVVCSFVKAQEEGIPQKYLDEIASEVGIWMADNSEYKNENEPMDAYALEWKYGPHRNNIYGRLYGLIEGKEAGTYWEFHKYWNPEKNQVVVMQIGWDGTLGMGTIKWTKENETELVQIFTAPDGSQRKQGHRTTKFGTDKEVGTSFTINDQNEWIPDRTYTWVKSI